MGENKSEWGSAFKAEHGRSLLMLQRWRSKLKSPPTHQFATPCWDTSSLSRASSSGDQAFFTIFFVLLSALSMRCLVLIEMVLTLELV